MGGGEKERYLRYSKCHEYIERKETACLRERVRWGEGHRGG